MPHFHLPVQSGSDAVLARMRRDYTVAEYLDRFDRLRAARPGIAITTDFIVGFPGETRRGLRGLARAPRARALRAELQLPLQPAPAHRREPAARLRAGVAGGAARGRGRAARAAPARRSAASRPRPSRRSWGGWSRCSSRAPPTSQASGSAGRPRTACVHLAAEEAAAPAGALVRARVTRAGGAPCPERSRERPRANGGPGARCAGLGGAHLLGLVAAEPVPPAAARPLRSRQAPARRRLRGARRARARRARRRAAPSAGWRSRSRSRWAPPTGRPTSGTSPSCPTARPIRGTSPPTQWASSAGAAVAALILRRQRARASIRA